MHKDLNTDISSLSYAATMRHLLIVLVILFLALPGQAADSVSLSPSIQGQITERPHLAGHRLAANDLKGRVVLISFFASWCPPCHKEFRHLNELEDEFGPKGLRIVAINQFEHYAGTRGAADRLDRFLGRHAPRFSVVKGGDGIGKTFENVQRIPTVFVFDQTGTKRFHFIHAEGATKMNPTLAELRAVLTQLFETQPQ